MCRRLIRQLIDSRDTPALIIKIAADPELMRICRTIVDPVAEPDPELDRTLGHICRLHGLSVNRLRVKLTPAASALGLAPRSTMSEDYYRLLGVRSQAEVQEIKRAFRQKAITVHPDTNANLAGNSRRFVEMNDAYRTLRDPIRRHQYDTHRQQHLYWHEQSGASLNSADSRPTIRLWLLIGLFLVFIFLFLIMDMIVFQNDLKPKSLTYQSYSDRWFHRNIPLKILNLRGGYLPEQNFQ